MSLDSLRPPVHTSPALATWCPAVLCLLAGVAATLWITLPLIAIAIVLAVAARAALVRQSNDELDRAHLQFIEALAQMLDARDPYTAGHSYRVGAYAHAIARAMGSSEREAEIIRVAALLHDIGKIGIPDAVLQKPGRLTAEEYGLIKLHPQIGSRILEKLGRFSDLLPVVELHHENFDGSGYPYKLAGDRIPLGARIVHVADAFDSMVTHRHYRNALPLEVAVGELLAHAGSQFDPEVCRVMVRLLEEGVITASDPGQILLRTDALAPVSA